MFRVLDSTLMASGSIAEEMVRFAEREVSDAKDSQCKLLWSLLGTLNFGIISTYWGSTGPSLGYPKYRDYRDYIGVLWG